jgi:hypothetical protein
MSFYGNVVNPPIFFSAIKVDSGETLTVNEAGMVLHLVGDSFISIDKESNNTIQIGAIVTDGLYVKSSDWNDNDPKTQKYFKLTVNSKGVLEIYEVTKEAN